MAPPVKALFLASLSLLAQICAGAVSGEEVRDFYHSQPQHNDNWAVIVDTSRFWSNYRHAANALTFYHIVKEMGIPDSNIILMLGDDIPCNPRNVLPATVFNNRDHSVDLYGSHVEVDYRGYEVTVSNFLKLLTGRHSPSLPKSKRLDSGRSSNVLIYMTGHGGDEFLKFQDAAEVTAQDMADTFAQMWARGRYQSLLFIVETCQAATLLNRFTAPNIIAVGSSLKDENSYSHHDDPTVGVSVIDRFTYYSREYIARLSPTSQTSVQAFFEHFDYRLLLSHVYWRSTHPTPLSEIPLVQFLSSKPRVEAFAVPTTTFPNHPGDVEGAADRNTDSADPSDPSDAFVKTWLPTSEDLAGKGDILLTLLAAVLFSAVIPWP